MEGAVPAVRKSLRSHSTHARSAAVEFGPQLTGTTGVQLDRDEAVAVIAGTHIKSNCRQLSPAMTAFSLGKLSGFGQDGPEMSIVALSGEKNRDSPVSDDLRGLVRRNEPRFAGKRRHSWPCAEKRQQMMINFTSRVRATQSETEHLDVLRNLLRVFPR